MNKVLITGANGFLGSHLALSLAQKKIQVIALVAKGLDYSFLVNQPYIQCIEFDLEHLEEIKETEALSNVDIIYHMAWSGVNSSLKNEAVLQAQNIIYSLSILEFAFKNNIKRVLIPGSAAEVSCSNNTITGKECPAPSDLYSAAKVGTRYLCQVYAQQHGIDLIWTLITSIYGPGRNDNNLISYTIKSLLKRDKPSLTKLEQKWDYLYIDDLIKALILLGDNGKGNKIYPIGSGEHYPMSTYVEKIRNYIDSSLPLGIGELPYKSSVIDNQIMDISELKKDTGFRPDYTFDNGIQITIEYFKSLLLSSHEI